MYRKCHTTLPGVKLGTASSLSTFVTQIWFLCTKILYLSVRKRFQITIIAHPLCGFSATPKGNINTVLKYRIMCIGIHSLVILDGQYSSTSRSACSKVHLGVKGVLCMEGEGSWFAGEVVNVR